MTKGVVVKQFFIDFIENLGESLDDDYCQDYEEEEATLILADLFFSGLLEIKWDPKKEKIVLKFNPSHAKQSTDV